MTQAEKETIQAFCRELALALRRITGRNVDIPPTTLPIEVQDSDISDPVEKTSTKQQEDEQ